MSTLGDLSINAKITVSEETAVRCIQLLNIYLADNPHISVRVNDMFDQDGKRFVGLWLEHNRPQAVGGEKE